jgi:hypothetical protein
MRSFVFIVCGLFLWGATASGQVARRTSAAEYVAPEDIFLTVAAQPDCPLKIEEAQLLISVNGGQPTYRYRLVHRGSKPIRYFTVVAWNSNGTGGTLSPLGMEEFRLEYFDASSSRLAYRSSTVEL